MTEYDEEKNLNVLIMFTFIVSHLLACVVGSCWLLIPICLYSWHISLPVSFVVVGSGGFFTNGALRDIYF